MSSLRHLKHCFCFFTDDFAKPRPWPLPRPVFNPLPWENPSPSYHIFNAMSDFWTSFFLEILSHSAIARSRTYIPTNLSSVLTQRFQSSDQIVILGWPTADKYHHKIIFRNWIPAADILTIWRNIPFIHELHLQNICACVCMRVYVCVCVCVYVRVRFRMLILLPKFLEFSIFYSILKRASSLNI